MSPKGVFIDSDFHWPSLTSHSQTSLVPVAAPSLPSPALRIWLSYRVSHRPSHWPCLYKLPFLSPSSSLVSVHTQFHINTHIWTNQDPHVRGMWCLLLWAGVTEHNITQVYFPGSFTRFPYSWVKLSILIISSSVGGHYPGSIALLLCIKMNVDACCGILV